MHARSAVSCVNTSCSHSHIHQNFDRHITMSKGAAYLSISGNEKPWTLARTAIQSQHWMTATENVIKPPIKQNWMCHWPTVSACTRIDMSTGRSARWRNNSLSSREVEIGNRCQGGIIGARYRVIRRWWLQTQHNTTRKSTSRNNDGHSYEFNEKNRERLKREMR